MFELPDWMTGFCAISGGIFLSGVGVLCFALGILILFFVYQIIWDLKGSR
tara:strand:- start:3999 stop:4148 length:150 start_codon:yes stop_codon:yes gene_type:complete